MTDRDLKRYSFKIVWTNTDRDLKRNSFKIVWTNTDRERAGVWQLTLHMCPLPLPGGRSRPHLLTMMTAQRMMINCTFEVNIHKNMSVGPICQTYFSLNPTNLWHRGNCKYYIFVLHFQILFLHHPSPNPPPPDQDSSLTWSPIFPYRVSISKHSLISYLQSLHIIFLHSSHILTYLWKKIGLT